MNRTFLLTAIVLTHFIFGVLGAHSEETNIYPKSRLELAEERTGVVLVRGTENVGSVA